MLLERSFLRLTMRTTSTTYPQHRYYYRLSTPVTRVRRNKRFIEAQHEHRTDQDRDSLDTSGDILWIMHGLVV